MALTQLRGSTQILDASIPASKFVAGLNLETSQLADGANFITKGGTVAYTANQSLGGFLLTNVGDAVSAQDAVNLRTAQSLINGISTRRARGVAITNQALTGLPTVDGVTYTAGQTLLLTGQTVGAQNGPWAVASGAWSRPSDWAAASSQKSTMWFVEEGTTYHDTKWIAITDAITVDTTSVSLSQDTSGATYTNGSGLSLTGSTFAVKNGNGIAFDGSSNVTLALDGSNLSLTASGLKIANGAAGQLMLANASGVATFTAMGGDATMASSGTVTVDHTAGSGFLKYTDFVYNETPGGAVNGSNTAFTLAATPQNASLSLFVRGQLQEPGAGNDYTISGAAITMLYAPLTGDKIRAYYTK
jgi:hypothetical protein